MVCDLSKAEAIEAAMEAWLDAALTSTDGRVLQAARERYEKLAGVSSGPAMQFSGPLYAHEHAPVSHKKKPVVEGVGERAMPGSASPATTELAGCKEKRRGKLPPDESFNIRRTVGARVRLVRETAGWVAWGMKREISLWLTEKDTAASGNVLSMVEGGHSYISLTRLERLAKLWGANFEFLACGTGEMFAGKPNPPGKEWRAK